MTILAGEYEKIEYRVTINTDEKTNKILNVNFRIVHDESPNCVIYNATYQNDDVLELLKRIDGTMDTFVTLVQNFLQKDKNFLILPNGVILKLKVTVLDKTLEFPINIPLDPVLTKEFGPTNKTRKLENALQQMRVEFDGQKKEMEALKEENKQMKLTLEVLNKKDYDATLETMKKEIKLQKERVTSIKDTLKMFVKSTIENSKVTAYLQSTKVKDLDKKGPIVPKFDDQKEDKKDPEQEQESEEEQEKKGTLIDVTKIEEKKDVKEVKEQPKEDEKVKKVVKVDTPKVADAVKEEPKEEPKEPEPEKVVKPEVKEADKKKADDDDTDEDEDSKIDVVDEKETKKEAKKESSEKEVVKPKQNKRGRPPKSGK